MDKNNVLEILYKIRTKLENGRVDMLTTEEKYTMEGRLQRCIERTQSEDNNANNEQEIDLYKKTLKKYENLLGNAYVYEVENLINRYKNNFAGNEGVVGTIRDINAELKSSIQEVDPALLEFCNSLIASLEEKVKDSNNYKNDEIFSKEDAKLLESLNAKVIDSQKEVEYYRLQLDNINKSIKEVEEAIKEKEGNSEILRNRLGVFIPATDLQRTEDVQNQRDIFDKQLNAYKEIRKNYNREKKNIERAITLAADFNSDYGNVHAIANRDLQIKDTYNIYAREMDMEKIEVLQACIKVLTYSNKDNNFNLDEEVKSLENTISHSPVEVANEQVVSPVVEEVPAEPVVETSGFDKVDDQNVYSSFIGNVEGDKMAEDDRQRMNEEIENIMNNSTADINHTRTLEISGAGMQPVTQVGNIIYPSFNNMFIPKEPVVEEVVTPVEEPTPVVEEIPVAPIEEVKPEIDPLMNIPTIEPVTEEVQVPETPVEEPVQEAPIEEVKPEIEPSINIEPITLEEPQVEPLPVVEEEPSQIAVDPTESFNVLSTKDLEQLLAQINEENAKREAEEKLAAPVVEEPQVEEIQPENMTMEEANETLANLNQELEEQQVQEPEVNINLGDEAMTFEQVDASEVQEKDSYEFTDDGKYHNELVKQVRTPEFVTRVSNWMDGQQTSLEEPNIEVQPIESNPNEITVNTSDGETNSFYVGENEVPTLEPAYQDNIAQFQEPVTEEMEEVVAKVR